MKLHVANLSPRVTEGLLWDLFSQYGEVVVIELAWTRAVGRTAGTAVIEMSSALAAVAASKAFNGRPFRSRRLYSSALEAHWPPDPGRGDQPGRQLTRVRD
jgi:RNA recognition motif-containing protein